MAGSGPPAGKRQADSRSGPSSGDTEGRGGYLARLQRAFDTGRPARDPVPPGIVDPMTNRELEVLGLLAAGRSNQAIAGELVVTLDTVKKHVGHVLGKLGAANRTEAVARARGLSLIP
jgi:LuxR family transcriptional regulator, maltose regulon positive regulatory protein